MLKEEIEKAARELGAAEFGVGSLDVFVGEVPERDPKLICPAAKCIVGFGFPVPKGLYRAMKEGHQFYGYTTLGVKAVDEEYFEIFLFRMASIIENAGYDACLQRTVPNLRVKGDKSVNPETIGVYELKYASPVEAGKPAPDIMIDFGKAAQACGIGVKGKSGRVINRKYGPLMRYAFIITDAPLAVGAPYTDNLCEDCDACMKACDCVGDTFKCHEKYANARGYSLPKTHWGYQACLCGKACDVACYEKLTGRNV